jgi:hypothetical protein
LTSFVAWVGLDSRGQASLHFASDSRITWGGIQPWDHGRKVFGSPLRPYAFGFVGYAFFPLNVLPSVIDILDANVGSQLEADYLFVDQRLRRAFDTLPSSERRPTTILFGAREGEGIGCRFRVWQIDAGPSWCTRELPAPETSAEVVVLGSGKDAVTNDLDTWERSSQGGTSRSIFSAFCDSLARRADPQTGGPPQLISIYRTGPTRPVGVCFQGRSYLAAVEQDYETPASSITEWRNTLFERCDQGGSRLPGAQPHGRPVAGGDKRRLP